MIGDLAMSKIALNATLASSIAAVLFMFFMYASNSWIRNVETRLSLIAEHDQKLSILQTRESEIARRLEVIDNKLDRLLGR